MVMPSNNISPVQGEGNRINPSQGGTVPSENIIPNNSQSVVDVFDRYRTEAIQRDGVNNETAESIVNNRVAEREYNEAIREAYDPWVSLQDAAAAEAMVLQFTRTGRTPSGGLDSFYVARRNTNDNEVQEVDNPNTVPNLLDSTLEANNQARTTMYQQMVQNHVVNQTTETQAQDQETRERYERIRNLYNNTHTLGRLFDRRA